MRSTRLLGQHTDRKFITDVEIGDVLVLDAPKDENTNPVFSSVGVVIDKIKMPSGFNIVMHDAFTGCLFEKKMKATLPGSKKKKSVSVLKPQVVEAEKLIARLNRAHTRLNFTIRNGHKGYFNDAEKVGVVVLDNRKWLLVQDNVPLCMVDTPTEIGVLYNGSTHVGNKRTDENYWFEYNPEEYERAVA